MDARKEFEKFLLEYTGRDIEWHKQGGTWGIDEDSFAYQCWMKNYEDAERYRWLKSRKGLKLEGKKIDNVLIREDGTRFWCPFDLVESSTQHARFPTLDEMIDSAKEVAEWRDKEKDKK